MDCLVLPLQEKIEEWKKSVLTLDKDHARGKRKKNHLPVSKKKKNENENMNNFKKKNKKFIYEIR